MNDTVLLFKFKCIGKAFFVLDCASYDVHLYKNIEQEKASQTFNICGGSFPELVSKLRHNAVHLLAGTTKFCLGR